MSWKQIISSVIHRSYTHVRLIYIYISIYPFIYLYIILSFYLSNLYIYLSLNLYINLFIADLRPICCRFIADLLPIYCRFIGDLLPIYGWFTADLLPICCRFVADLLLIYCRFTVGRSSKNSLQIISKGEILRKRYFYFSEVFSKKKTVAVKAYIIIKYINIRLILNNKWSHDKLWLLHITLQNQVSRKILKLSSLF